MIKLRHLAINLGIEKNVSFVGVVNNVAEHIEKTSLFILASKQEGMPNALIEAMAIGLPCVSTNFAPGSVSELIDHRDNGLIVPCDDPQSLSDALAYLADNEKKAEEMGEKAKAIGRKVDLTKISTQWKEVFERF